MVKVRKLKGRRRGQLHQHAYLTDHEVELIRQLREQDPVTWTVRALAAKFDSRRSTVHDIITYRRR